MFDLVEVTTNLAAQVKRSLYTDDVSLSGSSSCLRAWADVEHLWIDATNQSHSSRRQQILVSKPFLSPKKKEIKITTIQNKHMDVYRTNWFLFLFLSLECNKMNKSKIIRALEPNSTHTVTPVFHLHIVLHSFTVQRLYYYSNK